MARSPRTTRSVGALLAEHAAAFDVEARVAHDPIELPRRFADAPRDAEVVGLVAAALAYGRVSLFKPKLEAFTAGLGKRPARTLRAASPKKLLALAAPLDYRLTRPADAAAVLFAIARALDEWGSLEAAFAAHDEEPEPEDTVAALGGLVAWLRETALAAPKLIGGAISSRRVKHLLPDPFGGPCKRLHLWLRWMVRPPGPGSVDLGLWSHPSPARLLMPLDTHIARVAERIGLTERKTFTLPVAREITAALRRLDPDDPVRFDFALCHLGASGLCPARPVEEACSGCSFRPICRHWA